MSRIARLNNSSFKGVPFLFIDESAKRGQKIAAHGYPNSDVMFAEPLGKMPPYIKITGRVHGDNYFQLRLNLERALEEPGTGELNHPIYGLVTVQAGEFTVKSDQRNIGEFIFDMEFFSSSEVSPNPLPDTPNTVTKQADEARDEIITLFSQNFDIPTDAFELDEGSISLLGVLDSVQDSIDSVVGPIESAIAEANSQIANFRNKVRKIMQTATGLKDSVTNLYNNVVQLSLDPAALSLAWENLINFEITTPNGPTNTESRKRIENNRSIMNEQNRLMGVIGLYESIASTEFSTDDELNNAISIADDRYNQYFEDDPGILANNIDFRDSVSQIKVSTRISLNNQLQNIWRIENLKLMKTSMSLTSYRYYEGIDDINSLINLNPDVNVANIFDTIKALTK